MNPTDWRIDWENKLLEAGTAIRIQNPGSFTHSGTDYDVEYRQTGSPTINISGLGIKMPVSTSDKGDLLYMQQGKIDYHSDKMFIHGSLTVDPAAIIFYNGSPFEITNEGILSYELSGVSIYKKLYVKVLNWSGNWYG